jgi:hypothetical protein
MPTQDTTDGGVPATSAGSIWVGHPRPGDRIRLVRTTDPFTDLEPGALGWVTNRDSLGTVEVAWDSGSTLGLIPEDDAWEVLLTCGHPLEGTEDVEACPTCGEPQ